MDTIAIIGFGSFVAASIVGGLRLLGIAMRTGKTPELVDYIARGRNDRMQSFDQHLLDLLKANKIAVETALAAASNPTDFQTRLALEGHEPGEEGEAGKPMEAFEVESDGRF